MFNNLYENEKLLHLTSKNLGGEREMKVSIAVKSFSDQRPGTSGLRKREFKNPSLKSVCIRLQNKHKQKTKQNKTNEQALKCLEGRGTWNPSYRVFLMLVKSVGKQLLWEEMEDFTMMSPHKQFFVWQPQTVLEGCL